MKKATKKIFAPKPQKPVAAKPEVPIAKQAPQARIDQWISSFLLMYPAPLRDEISRLIEDRARHWRFENEIAQLGAD